MKQIEWKEIVPAAKHGAVEKALEQSFGTTELEEIAPLTSGRSSALVFKIVVQGKAYVLRIVMQVDALTDPSRHFVALNAAANAGIAPPVHYTDAEDAISIVDFIEHEPLRTRFNSEEDLFGTLATTIKAIHSLPLFPALVDFIDGVDSLIQGFQSASVLSANATEELFGYYSIIRNHYPRKGETLVSSHNDLNPTNILQNGGKLWVIDWEVAFANNRYVDLAIVNIFFGSGQRGEETLLNTYFGDSLNDEHRARFFLMQQVCFIYIAMLFMHLVSGSGKPKSFFSSSMETMNLSEFQMKLRNGELTMASPQEHLLFAKVLLNESLSQMKTKRFQESIELVGLKPNDC